MSSTPSNRTFAANSGQGLRLTPSTNSSNSRAPRSPNKSRGVLYESGLSLRRIIGTTVSSPTAFDSLSTSQVFAYTAGAAAIVVNLAAEEKDGEGGDNAPKYLQRFFRARPTAVPLNVYNNFSGPSTPTQANRSSVRDSAVPYAPTTPHTSLDWSDSPSGKTWTSRERIKAATCLSLSRDGKLLAVGETGYSPRVLIFSLLENSSDAPLVILSEHTFGVRAVAFSADQKYLASLGSPNDGFIYVWSINQRTGAAKLHSSNKCTSSVKQMIWLGNNIVTVGTRHVKVWRVEDDRTSRSMSPTKPRYALDGTPQPIPRNPALKTLSGRNILLGPLVEVTFTAVAVVSEQRAIVCSEKGDVCLLDDTDGQKLMKLTNTGFWITCLAVDHDSRQLRIGGKNGQVKVLNLDELLAPSTPPDSPMSARDSVLTTESSHLCAMGFAAGHLITVNSHHSIEISGVNHDSADSVTLCAPFQAHGDAVLGVRLLSQPNERNAVFITWSANGTVKFWDLDGTNKGTLKVDVEQGSSPEEDTINQCLIVRASRGAAFLAIGDRHGTLRVVNSATQTCTFEARAHISDIQDIAVFESLDTTLIATCGRDRTVQLFRLLLGQWELFQTLDDHSASVCGLIFAENGEKLISCSTDRTIHIRQLVKTYVDGKDMIGAVPVRIITLKASPISMVACLDEPMRTFVVSLLDRTVATYEISSGRLVSSFRATDSDGNDSVALDALHVGMPSAIPGKPTILAGVSSTDKSVRIYDKITGSLLDREWGHTAAVTDVALLEPVGSDQKTLISTGSDGTIMIWDLSPRPYVESMEFDRESSPPKEITTVKPALRRVLSRASLAEFQRSSPVSTPPTNRSSPPRVIRRKTSRYGLSASSPTIPPIPTNSKHFTSASEDSSSVRRGAPRNRSRSPPPSPKARDVRRPSLADSRARTKSTGNFSEFGTLNMATEQTCRTLRAFRKKLLSSESVKEDVLRELDQELRLTAVALSEKSHKPKPISETVLSGLLDQYSDRLVSMFDEKLRLTLEPKSLASETKERPKTANPSIPNTEH